MDAIKEFTKFQNEEQFYSYFEKNEIHFDEAIRIPKEKVVETEICEKYEYGLSDW